MDIHYESSKRLDDERQSQVDSSDGNQVPSSSKNEVGTAQNYSNNNLEVSSSLEQKYDQVQKGDNKEEPIEGVPGLIPRRVKVYLLQGEDWLDNGTGYCVGEIDSQTKHPYFLVRNELDSEDIILKLFLEGSIQYQRQQETLIVWTDLSGKDLALLFQESEGCNDLCEFIIKVQQENLSPDISLYYVIPNMLEESMNDNGGENGNVVNNDITELITGPITYPPDPKTENLEQIIELFNQNSNSKFTRRTVLTFIIRNDYLSKLIAVFEKLEKETLEKNLQSLYILSDIVKTLLLFNETSLIEHILQKDELIWGIISILEYDSNYPKFKAVFRDSYKQNSFKLIIEIPQEYINMFKKDFHLNFFKDVVLVRFLDDATFNMLSSLIYINQVEIIEFVKEEAFLKQLFALYETQGESEVSNGSNDPSVTLDTKGRTPQELDDSKRNGVKMLHQYVLIAKNLQSFQKLEFFANLVKNGLFKMLSFALKDTESKIRVLGTELIVIIIEQDVSLVNSIDNEDAIDDLDPPRRSVLNGEITAAASSILEEKHNELKRNIAESNDQGSEEGGDDDSYVKSKNLRLKLSDDMTLITILSNLLLEDKSPGLKIQAFEALRILLDSDIASPTGSSTASVTANEEPEQNDDFHEINTKNYFQAFYSTVAPQLFQSLIELARNDNDFTRERVLEDILLHQQLCDLISYCAKEHEVNIARPFFLENDILLGVALMLHPNFRIVLKLSAIRCLRSIILLNDDEYTKYIVEKNLFDYFFEFLAAHKDENNLLNSTCLDVLEVLLKNCDPSSCFRRKNFQILVSHIYAKHKSFLEKDLVCVSTGRDLVQIVEYGFFETEQEGVVDDSDELAENNKEIDTEQLSPGSDDYEVEHKSGTELKYKSPTSLFQNIDHDMGREKRQLEGEESNGESKKLKEAIEEG